MDPISPTGSGPQQPIQPPVTLPASMQPGWLPPPAPGYRWDADRRTGQWAQVPATPLSPARPPTPRERWGWFAAEPGEPSVAGLHPRWLLVALAVLVLLPVCTCISLQSLFGPRYTYSSPSVVYIAPTETPLPTLPPTPTNTPTPTGPRPIDTPTLGGTVPAFDTAFGPYSTRWFWSGRIAGQYVTIAGDMSRESDALDGQQHAFIVIAQVPNELLGQVSWDQATADQIARTFLPADARYIRDGPGAPAGVTDHIYQSASLAATFQPALFTDDGGSKSEQPGTLHYECGPLGPSNGIAECYMSVGTQY